MDHVAIQQLGQHVGESVTLAGWLYNKRSSGKIHFLILRDGTGLCQCVMGKNDVPAEAFAQADRLTQESAVKVTGTVRAESRAPGGYELNVTGLEVVAEASPDYPITPKEHGVEFLMDHRHLWMRTPRQVAILRIRATIVEAIRTFLNERGFVLVDPPILTPSAAEGTTNLFETDYFGEKAYLSQSGQLYMEAAAMALGKVYSFGPTFRAEKSKTRRHLIEFWMIEPEMAYWDQDDNMRLQEELISHIVQTVLSRHQAELKELGRDTTLLEKVKAPFPRVTYDEALKIIKERDNREIPWGEDFGAPDETVIADAFQLPTFVTHYPVQAKAFYMKPDPKRPEVVLCADLLAPEGYGEIIGGSQRIDDLDLLEGRIKEHQLPAEAYGWYLDLRRYGSVPHSGFGIGLERTVAWLCGLDHVRETIPFPRLLNRIYP